MAQELEDAKEYPEAEKIYQQAIDAGSGEAASKLSLMYWSYDPTKHARRMFELDTIAAERNNAEGEVLLGIDYAIGGAPDVPTDPARGVALYARAAQQNNALGLELLGEAYIKGIGGLKTNFITAEGLLNRSAKLREVGALIELGKLYSYGQGGIVEDHMKAIALLKEAAHMDENQGVPELAKEYLYIGKPSLAVTLLMPYASDGPYAAQALLACLFHEGLGVRKNDAKAIELLKRAKLGEPFCGDALIRLKQGKNDAWKTLELETYGDRLEKSP
ncbi:MAG TPA: tetratricopeptide repeat protein [Fimbriimonadaceae bacterium]|jgi:TPR repeat protein